VAFEGGIASLIRIKVAKGVGQEKVESGEGRESKGRRDGDDVHPLD